MFGKTRLKLTAWYLLIIMTISLAFSAVIYGMMSMEINRVAQRVQRFRLEQQLRELGVPLPPRILVGPQEFSNDTLELLSDSKKRLVLNLLGINGLILVSSGVLGYLLAGRTLSPIKEMLDEQNRFISDSSHELRTPLTALKTSLEVFLRDRNPSLKEAKTTISDSLLQVNQLQSLSDNLLTLAQYQKPRAAIYFNPLSLLDITQQAVKKIKPLADAKNIQIKNRVSGISIEAQSSAICDLLVILLDNAVKYSLPDSMISLISKKENGRVLISVADQGIGIAKSELPHIFDRFYRADSARSRERANGYGLGLSIAKKIVETHRGHITVESRLKKGTTFTIILPIHQLNKKDKLFS